MIGIKRENIQPQNGDVLSIVPFDGNTKSYKKLYIFKYLNRQDKVEDEIIGSSTIAEARNRIKLVISYVPDPDRKKELKKDLENTYKELQNTLEEEKKAAGERFTNLSDQEKLDCYISAAIDILGRVKEEFDDAYGWYEKRCVMVIGPFGDAANGVRRSAINIDEVPEDGEYINIKTGKKINIRLKGLIMRNIKSVNNPEEDNDDEEGDMDGSSSADASAGQAC